ncbi:hypothetical protein HDV04_004573 [Boothiomyces sp. JEL0838]|nr:hypothetical protein HDV04_004573 [Boothiomyces sp. JEL0838]
MADIPSIGPALTIINAVLWSLFGHFSQPFDWIALYLWIVNNYQLSNPVVRSLVLMPTFRLLGDAVWEGLDAYDSLHNTTSGFAMIALPSPLWYAGELMGDMYLPLKASTIVGTDKILKMIIWGIYSLIVGGKSVQIVGRYYYWYQSKYDSSQDKVAYFVNTVDIYIMFVGILNDLVCSLILYSRAKGMFNIKRKQILKTIQTNSSFRIVVYTIFKIVIGIYWAMNICDATYVQCPFYFLRDIIITLDYQLYYLDYFLIQYFGKEKTKGLALQNEPKVETAAGSPPRESESDTVKRPTGNKSTAAD